MEAGSYSGWDDLELDLKQATCKKNVPLNVPAR